MSGSKKHKRLRSILFGIFALYSLSATVWAAALIDPPEVEWGCVLSNTKVVSGIREGASKRGWMINHNVSPLVAKIIVRGKHTLIVGISYSDTAYDINYVSSENLKYKLNSDGSVQIHGNASKWMETLRRDIAIQLSRRCSD